MKTKFKGSEGKWGCVFTSDKKRAVRNKGGIICTLYHPSKYSGQGERYDLELEQTRADQRLIANAPEMIKMLVDIFEQENLSQSCHDEVYKLIQETLT